MSFGIDTEMSSRFYQIYARTLRRATETHIRVLRCMRLQNKLMARVTLASYENDKRCAFSKRRADAVYSWSALCGIEGAASFA